MVDRPTLVQNIPFFSKEKSMHKYLPSDPLVGVKGGWGKTLTLPCLSTGTASWAIMVYSEKLLNIIALMKCEDCYTKKI